MTFGLALNGTITLGSTLPDITQDLTIDGAGHTLAVDDMAFYRIFTIGAGATVVGIGGLVGAALAYGLVIATFYYI